jgi:hypothetical protein
MWQWSMRPVMDTCLADGGTGSSTLVSGAAAADRTNAKFRTYGELYHPDRHTLFAAILEQSGAASKQLHLLVKMVAKFEHDRTEGAYPISACVQRWRQRFSITLQRAISESEARLSFKVRVPLQGQPDNLPVLDGYKGVKLLRRVAVVPPVDAQCCHSAICYDC